ncbi:MAG: hypothetical protein H6831_05320 [Planctomycetes bacterium]|nr:hypothetical protein [Planctomycetota bacterium]
MTDFARALLRDLAAASEHLLDEGFASRAGAAARIRGVRGPLGITLRLADALQRATPRALQELERLPATGRETIVAVREPRRATPSRRPYDYAEHAGALAPVVFESRRPELELPTEHLAWIAHGLALLLERLEDHRNLLDLAYDEAVRFREGSSFGDTELALLDSRRSALDVALRATADLRARLARQSPTRLSPTPRLPYPFPQTPAWRSLRTTIRALTDPAVHLPTLAADLQDPDASGIDLAYLYQRWCGLRLIETLHTLGLRPTTDPIPPLLLAGAIEFRSQDPTQPPVTLLCEPRLASYKRPLHGLFVTHGETSPDFVLLSESSVYVLDPTLSHSPELHRQKAKYLDVLSIARARTVAGVRFPTTGPDRSWAAAPIAGEACRPNDWRGASGVVPMRPGEVGRGALADWVRDLLSGG